MTVESPHRGTITKVVRVALDCGTTDRHRDSDSKREGYGLLRGQDGQEVFFVDTDVEDGLFSELRIGETVSYHVEPGPIVRAVIVRRVGHTSPNASEPPRGEQN